MKRLRLHSLRPENALSCLWPRKKFPKFASQVTWIVADSETGERREKGEEDEEGNAIFDLVVGEDEQVRMLLAKLTKRWWVTDYGWWSGVRKEKKLKCTILASMHATFKVKKITSPAIVNKAQEMADLVFVVYSQVDF